LSLGPVATAAGSDLFANRMLSVGPVSTQHAVSLNRKERKVSRKGTQRPA
jgi:hypothetical protein